MTGDESPEDLRRRALAGRRAYVAGLSMPERARAAGLAAERAIAWLQARCPRPGVAALSLAHGPELDPAPLGAALSAAGWRLAYPRAGEAAVMSFHLAHAAELAPGPHGVAEPPAGAPMVRPQLVVAPLVAFDARGARLGRGGGHYDRALHALRLSQPVVALGLAWDVQEVERLTPMPWDQPLDAVATPTRLVEPPGGR